MSATDTVVDRFDAYSADQVRDLTTGVLAELKKNVDAEVAVRLAELKALMPQPKTRGPRKQKVTESKK